MLAALFCLIFTASVQAGIQFHMGKDPLKWEPVRPQTRFEDNIFEELVPKGDNVNAWKELVTLQSPSTGLSLRKYVDNWEIMLRKGDSRIKIKEEVLGDCSIVVTYTSASKNEISVRRFMDDNHRLYILAYHVRPKFEKNERLRIWSDIIRTATVFPDPRNDEIA
jgi:hypothetical protein